MKKRVFFAASIAAVVFTACTEDEYLINDNAVQNESGEITFACANEALTRADNIFDKGDAAGELDSNFVVVGYKKLADKDYSIVFDHYNVNYTSGSKSESNTKNWEYVEQSTDVKGFSGKFGVSNAKSQTIKYWDYTATEYNFFAFSMGTGDGTSYASPTVTGQSSNEKGAADLIYTFKGTAEALGTLYCSNLAVVSSGNYKNVVTLTFNHVSPKVRVGIYDAVPGYKIKDVKFYNHETYSQSEGTAPTPTDEAYLYTSNDYFYPTTTPTSTYTLKFDAVTDGTKPTITFSNAASSDKSDSQEQDQKFGTLSYTDGYLGESSSTSSMTVYKYVFPTPTTGVPLTLKVDYTLVSDDGSGESISVKGATAVVPEEYSVWQMGYAYTYIFKISQNTNGTTGTPNTDDSGLYPITFDACVVGYHIEETITTVSDASITTHAILGDSVVYGKDEYVGGSTIAATVVTGTTTANLTSDNTKLYTATLTKGANATDKPATVINEASVAKAVDGAITDKNGWILTLTDVTSTSGATIESSSDSKNDILQWTASGSETYYVIQYKYTKNNTDTYAYKVVHVTPIMSIAVTLNGSAVAEQYEYLGSSKITATIDDSFISDPSNESHSYSATLYAVTCAENQYITEANVEAAAKVTESKTVEVAQDANSNSITLSVAEISSEVADKLSTISATGRSVSWVSVAEDKVYALAITRGYTTSYKIVRVRKPTITVTGPKLTGTEVNAIIEESISKSNTVSSTVTKKSETNSLASGNSTVSYTPSEAGTYTVTYTWTVGEVTVTASEDIVIRDPEIVTSVVLNNAGDFTITATLQDITAENLEATVTPGSSNAQNPVKSNTVTWTATEQTSTVTFSWGADSKYKVSSTITTPSIQKKTSSNGATITINKGSISDLTVTKCTVWTITDDTISGEISVANAMTVGGHIHDIEDSGSGSKCASVHSDIQYNQSASSGVSINTSDVTKNVVTIGSLSANSNYAAEIEYTSGGQTLTAYAWFTLSN